jgi:TPR repeat protein
MRRGSAHNHPTVNQYPFVNAKVDIATVTTTARMKPRRRKQHALQWVGAALAASGVLTWGGPACAGAQTSIPFASMQTEDGPRLEQARTAWENHQDDAAVRIWQALALHDNGRAWYNMGQAYRLGRGTTSNLDAAIVAYRLAARFGYPKAREQLGLTLYQIPARKAEGLKLLIEVADNGGPRAAYVVGLAEMKGDDLPQDNARAISHLTVAATSGVDEAWAPLTILRASVLDKISDNQPAIASLPAAQETTTIAGDNKAAIALSQPIVSASKQASGPLAAASEQPATITITADHAMTLDEIATELARTSGMRVDFALNADDAFKRHDATHRLRITWKGSAPAFADQIAHIFKLSAKIDRGAISFSSIAPANEPATPNPLSASETQHAIPTSGSSGDHGAGDRHIHKHNHRRRHRQYGG